MCIHDLASKQSIGVSNFQKRAYYFGRVDTPSTFPSIKLWHQQLGHPSRQTFNLIIGIEINEEGADLSDVCCH